MGGGRGLSGFLLVALTPILEAATSHAVTTREERGEWPPCALDISSLTNEGEGEVVGVGVLSASPR